jgi:hypothetical protein
MQRKKKAGKDAEVEGDVKKRRPKRKNKKENYINGAQAKAINELQLKVKKNLRRRKAYSSFNR